MSYLFNGINAFDSPLFIRKSPTDNTINLLQTTGISITSTVGTATPLTNLYDFNATTLVTCTPDGSNNWGLIVDLGVGIEKYCNTLILNNFIPQTQTTINMYWSDDNITYNTILSVVIPPSSFYNFICLINSAITTKHRYFQIIFSAIVGTFYIGEMVFCSDTNLFYISMPAGVQSIVNNYSEKVAFNELIDGGFIGAITSVKYGATYGYEWLPQSDRDNLKTLKDSRTDFAVIPSPQATNEICHVYWTNPWNFSFTDKYENAGYTGTIEVREL